MKKIRVKDRRGNGQAMGIRKYGRKNKLSKICVKDLRGASSSQRMSSNAIVAYQPQTSKPRLKGNRR